jgi:hypothetical protein
MLEAVRALCDEKSAVWFTADSSGRWADRLDPFVDAEVPPVGLGTVRD